MASYCISPEIRSERESTVVVSVLKRLNVNRSSGLADIHIFVHPFYSGHYVSLSDLSTIESWILLEGWHLDNYLAMPMESTIKFEGCALPIIRSAPTLPERIDQVCSDPESLEENEPPPTIKAIGDIKQILLDAQLSVGRVVPSGDVAVYFGEVSVTWRNGNSMLRVTSFSGPQSPRLDFGTTPDGTLGEYQFEPNATGARLAEKLAWLFPEESERVRVQ